MPIYEYECPECKTEFEELQSFGAAPPACPECGSKKTERRLSLASFHLKGSGWYAKDAKSPSGQTKNAKSENKSESSSTEKSCPASGGSCGSCPVSSTD